FFFFSSRRRHTRFSRDWSSDVCSSDLTSDMFGGNSNWRGPIWIPINFIIIQSIRKLGKFYHDSLKVEYPSGSGEELNLFDISKEIGRASCRERVSVGVVAV